LVDDDNDFDHQKRERQTKDQAGYDGPDEEDRAVIRQQDEEEARELDSQAELGMGRRAENENAAKTLEENLVIIDLNDMKQINPNLVRFDFDKTNGEWCEVELEVMSAIKLSNLQYPLKMGKILMENIVEKVCQACIVREISGIQRCVKLPKKQETDQTVSSLPRRSNI
jgi:DNA-directed RNA polymerase I subunit RPA1